MSAAKVELGRHLFYDTRLSGNASASCASCHRQERAFTDGLPRALGSTGELHPRSSMTLTNVAYNATFTWANPTLESLEDQIRIPLLNDNPIELGVAGNEDLVLARLREAARYRELFRAAFPELAEPITLDNVTKALASFSRTLTSGGSAYDRLVYLDERESLSASARRGMRLFFSDRVRCSECHQGFNFSGPVRYRGAAAPGVFHNTGLYNLEGRGLYPPDNPGLSEFTGLRDDTGRFRAPTLRKSPSPRLTCTTAASRRWNRWSTTTQRAAAERAQRGTRRSRTRARSSGASWRTRGNEPTSSVSWRV